MPSKEIFQTKTFSKHGKAFKISDVDILKFNVDGLAPEHWAVQDYCAMFSQLGVAPPAK